MAARDVTVPTPDGPCGASLHLPEGDQPRPAVIMFPDIASLRPTFRTMGERLAGLGYVVLVPDLYHRSQPYPPFDPSTMFSDPDEYPRARAMAALLTPDAIAADAEAFVAFLAEQPEVAPGPVGTTGYCFGGKLSLTVAGRLGDAIGAAASIHGGGLGAADDPTSPHLLADGVRAAVYVGAAANDRSFPADQETRLREAYDAAGVRCLVESYDAPHGFAVPDFPVFDEAASERHWAALERFYGAELG